MNKKIFLIGLFLMFGFFMLISSNKINASSVTIDTPASTTGIIVGESNISGTVEGGNVTKVWVYVSSSSTENNTLTGEHVALWSGASPTQNLSKWNITWNTTAPNIVGDSDDYSVKVIALINATENVTSTNTNIRIDNFIPGVPSSLSPADKTKDTDGDVTFTATINSKNVTHCYLWFEGRFPEPNNPKIMTDNGDNTCSLTINSIPEQKYKWYIEGSDRTNSTSSYGTTGTYTLIIDKSTGIGKGAAFEEELRKGTMEKTKEGFYVIKEKKPLSLATITETKYLGVPTLGWIIIVIIVGSLLYVYYKKK